MIRRYDALRFVRIEDWPISYRFTEERYNQLSPEKLATIRPLADYSAEQLAELHDLAELARQARSNSLSADWERAQIGEDNWDACRAWLENKRPRASDDIYVEWVVRGYCAAVVAWQTFCEYVDDFLYPFEIVLVIDDTCEWQILMGPNDFACWRRTAPSIVCRSSVANQEGDDTVEVDEQSSGGHAFEMSGNPKATFDALIRKGVSAIEAIRQIRKLYGLSLEEAMLSVRDRRSAGG